MAAMQESNLQIFPLLLQNTCSTVNSITFVSGSELDFSCCQRSQAGGERAIYKRLLQLATSIPERSSLFIFFDVDVWLGYILLSRWQQNEPIIKFSMLEFKPNNNF
jgi:hypothetical protein